MKDIQTGCDNDILVKSKVSVNIDDTFNAKGAVNMLYQIYNKGYAFPKWILDADLKSYQHQTIVYYPKGTRIDVVMRLLTEMEPVNIAMTRYYDQDKMKHIFGWKTGAYGRLGSLPPNIAVYVGLH